MRSRRVQALLCLIAGFVLQLLCAWSFALLGSRGAYITQIGLSGSKELGWSAFDWSDGMSEADRKSLQHSTLRLIRDELGDEFIDELPEGDDSHDVTREISVGVGLTFERIYVGQLPGQGWIDRIDLFAGWPFRSVRCSFPEMYFFSSLEPEGHYRHRVDWVDAWQIWVELEVLPVWGQEGSCFGPWPAPVQLRPLPRRICTLATVANTVLFGSVLWSVRFGPGLAMAAWRKHRTGCPCCGYDIRGVSRCPECGTSVSPMTTTAPAR